MHNFSKNRWVFLNNQQMKGIGAEIHHGEAIIHAAKINIVAEMNAECGMSNSEFGMSNSEFFNLCSRFVGDNSDKGGTGPKLLPHSTLRIPQSHFRIPQSKSLFIKKPFNQFFIARFFAVHQYPNTIYPRCNVCSKQETNHH